MAVEKAEFRRALGHFAAAVTVITTKLDSGDAAGITVTAFSSLSLDPPLVLICIDHRAKLHAHLKVDGFFAANILAEDQEVCSRRFASSEPNQFREIGYTEGVSGVPLIQGAIANLECRITQAVPGGDHTIFIGEVEATHVHEGKPLVYFRGGYAALK